MERSIAVDIGGTKIAVACVNKKGELFNKVELSSKTDTQETMFERVIETIELFFMKSKTEISDYIGIGVGVPGKVDIKKGIAVYQNNLPWADFPIVKRLLEIYPETKIKIDNDVYQAAFAEWIVSGVSRDDIFVYYTISTGISCSIIQDGQFIRGNGFAGEVGLMPVIDPREGNKVERLETMSAGPGIEKEASERLGYKVTTKELYDLYHKKNKEAIQLVENQVESLAHSIYNVICLIDPKKITFGGSISIYQSFLIEKIQIKLSEFVIDAQKNAVKGLEVSKLDNNAGIIGAGLRLFY